MYSTNFGGMRGMGSRSMQVPQMSMIGMMGNGGFNPQSGNDCKSDEQLWGAR
jgi:hypothetical protein